MGERHQSGAMSALHSDRALLPMAFINYGPSVRIPSVPSMCRISRHALLHSSVLYSADHVVSQLTGLCRVGRAYRSLVNPQPWGGMGRGFNLGNLQLHQKSLASHVSNPKHQRSLISPTPPTPDLAKSPPTAP